MAPPRTRQKPKATKQRGNRPKALVFAVDEIPHVAALANALAIPEAVRRSPFYFYPSEHQPKVKLPPDRVCDREETEAGMAFLDRLVVDLWTRDWKPDIFPRAHIRSWHDVPIDVLVGALDTCGFEVVRAPAIMAACGLAESAGLAGKLPAPASAPTTDLFFADLFGLTRVTADGSVRNVAKLSGSGLSIDAEGRLGLLRKQDGVRVIVALSKMREVGALDTGALMHPAGGAVVRLMPDLAAFDVDVLNSGATAVAGKLRPSIHVEAAPARAPLRAGGDSIDLVCEPLVAFDDAGNTLAWLGTQIDAGGSRSARSVLFRARFPTAGDDPTVDWRVELRGPARGVVSLSVAGGVAVACVRDVATSKVHVAVFGDDGAARVRSVDSVIAPARVGQTLVYQPDTVTVVREPLDGGTPVRHTLAAAHAGRGRVVSRGDRWLFVPGHGGALIDLENGGRVLDRGLPAAEAQARADAFDFVAKVAAIVTDAGMEATLDSIDAKHGSRGVALSGGGPVLARALETAVGGYLSAGPLRGGFSIRGSYYGTINRRVTLDEIVELLRFFDAHEMKLEWAVFFLDSLHQFPVGMSATPEPAKIEPDAEGVLLWAAVDEVVPAGGTFAARLAAWMKDAPTPARVAERLAAVDDNTAGWTVHLLNTIAWITVSRFGAEALDIWLPIPERRLRFMGAINALAWLAKNEPSARRRLASWFATVDEPHENWRPLADVLGAKVESDDDANERLPVRAPAGFAKPTTWDALAAAWSGARQIDGLVEERASGAPADVAKQLGIPALPPSYLEYLRRFYAAGELRQKYEREKFPYFLQLLAPAGLAAYCDAYEDSLSSSADITVELRQTAKTLSGLLPFGSNTSRVWICWDPKQRNADGEMMICFIDGDEWNAAKARTDLGYDLKEVVKYYQPGTLDERG
jgi:hypothetical protein